MLPDAWRMGGRVRSVFNLAGSLADRHHVEIASAARSQLEPALPPPTGVALLPLLSDVELAGYVTDARTGVVIGTSPAINVVVAQHRADGVLAIGQEHAELGWHQGERLELIREWYPRLDALVSLTDGDAAAYRALLAAGVRTLCIPNAIADPGDVRADLTQPVAVAAGRLVPSKGYDLLLRAWRKVVQVHPDWRLRIFGEGPARPKLERQLTRLGLADSVQLPGFTDHLDEELARGSFFVLSSRHEGLPMVIIEAMAVGLPVVSFDCPTGPRDLVGPEEGFLVPNGKVVQLARAMTAMIDLGPGREVMGAAACSRSGQFRLPAITGRWEDLFDELANPAA